VVRELAAEVVACAHHAEALEAIEGVSAITVDLLASDGPARLVGQAVEDPISL
jgi:hypothetical protein